MRIYTLNTELEPGVGYSAFSDQDDTAWRAQNNWLASELAADNNLYIWSVASYHRPLRPHRGSKSEGLLRYSEWAPLFDQYGMDLAIECDSHLAKYTFPVRSDSGSGSFEGFIRDDANGTVYIGEGSWGAPTRDNDDDKPWTLASDSFWQFNLIQVDQHNIHIRKVKFGSENYSYDPATVGNLSQNEQDLNAFAIPAGLDLWQPLAGETLSLPFTGADIDNIRLISTNDSWKYLDNGTFPGNNWNNAGFDDSSWTTGSGQFGYGDGDEQTVISFGGVESNKHITTWFRNEISIGNPDDIIRLTLRLLRDDGAVIYINGVEAVRSNMPEGEITATTLAQSSVGGSSEDRYIEIPINPDLLDSGVNIIAVEVHQSSPTSSDLSFDLDLTAIQSMVSGMEPVAPTDLGAVSTGPDVIELSWNDNADNEVKYELQRKIGDGLWQIIETQLDKDTVKYTNNMLSEGQEYSYRVRCYNAAGRSLYSNEITINTLTNPVPAIPGYSWDFENNSLGTMTAVSVSSSKNWGVREHRGSFFARMNGFGADQASDDWLITPALPLSFFNDVSISFDSAYNFSGPELEVHVSSDYSPETGTGTWSQLQSGTDFLLPQTGRYNFVNSGDVDLASYASEQTHVAFRYVSTGTGGGEGRIWQVDNIVLRGTPVRLLAIEPFDGPGLGSWYSYSHTSSADWRLGTRAGQQGAFCNGFGADAPSDDWLISPSFAINEGDAAMLHFDYYARFGGPMLEVYISDNYPGSGYPMDEGVSWHQIEVGMDSSSDAVWKSIEGFDISSYSGVSVHLAFRYVSTGTGPGDGRRWGVDNIGVSLMPPIPLAGNLHISSPNGVFTTAEPVTFTASITGGKAPYTYAWDFGNGELSTEQEPVITYQVANNYTVTLTVTDDSETTKTLTADITVVQATEEPVPEKLGNLRIAAFNILMSWRDHAQGRLIEKLAAPDWTQAQKVAEIIQRTNPDVILLNEFDYDAEGQALINFQANYLGVSQNGAAPVNYQYTFIAPANTGVPSGVDFNNDGDTTDPEDSFGYGWYPGAYGMAILSKYPISVENIRTFQKFLWKDMPGNMMPTDYYSEDAQQVFRLSSKSHWDVPVVVNGKMIHILGSHPTPPVFDGPEDRNGRRNHDEIRFWADYVTPDNNDYIYDDNNDYGGLPEDASFVIVGDQNADPDEGDSTDNAIWQLTENSFINASLVPTSNGAVDAGKDDDDTASWGLRADYVLPSVTGLTPLQGHVFWPVSTDVRYHLVRNDISSDHRMVWLDLEVSTPVLTGDLDGDGDIDRDDIRIIRANLRQPASVNPACDLNNDGRISIHDVRKAVTMCTRNRCATR